VEGSAEDVAEGQAGSHAGVGRSLDVEAMAEVVCRDSLGRQVAEWVWPWDREVVPGQEEEPKTEMAVPVLDGGERWRGVVFHLRLSQDDCLSVPSCVPPGLVASRRGSHHEERVEQQHQSWKAVACVVGEGSMILVAPVERHLLEFAPRAWRCHSAAHRPRFHTGGCP
jgi:hypothetical protein